MRLSATAAAERERERELIMATILESGAASTARGIVVRSSALYDSYELWPTHSLSNVAAPDRSSRLQFSRTTRERAKTL